MLPKALKSCTKYNKSPNLVTLASIKKLNSPPVCPFDLSLPMADNVAAAAAAFR